MRLFKKRYKIIEASSIISTDVSQGFENRNINKKKIVIVGRRKMQYTQNLTVQVGGQLKKIHVYVDHKIKTHKDNSVELILKPKKVGDKIRMS